jgi:hypothetical protein
MEALEEYLKLRLPFSPAPSHRVAWASESAAREWGPRLAFVRRAKAKMAVAAVAVGRMRASVIECAREDADPLRSMFRGRGVLLPMGGDGTRFSIGREDDAKALSAAVAAGDMVVSGGLQGTPNCCVNFSSAVRRAHIVDPTWITARAGAPGATNPTVLSISQGEMNVVLGRLGISTVLHQPCSTRCGASIAIANELADLWRQVDAETWPYVRDILRWPAEWSSLHGAIEIRTPVLKVGLSGDALASTLRVRYHSNEYPPGAATGTRFPYKPSGRRPTTDTTGFRRGIENLVALRVNRPSWYHLDNEFMSRPAMEEAHDRLVSSIAATIPDLSGPVLDVGCGNGALLRALTRLRAHVDPYGIEINPRRLDHAKSIWPEKSRQFTCADMYLVGTLPRTPRRYRLAVIGLAHCDGSRGTPARALLRWLFERAEAVVSYDHGSSLQPSIEQRRLAMAGLNVTQIGPAAFVLSRASTQPPRKRPSGG